jgi:hypothetical protein
MILPNESIVSPRPDAEVARNVGGTPAVTLASRTLPHIVCATAAFGAAPGVAFLAAIKYVIMRHKFAA